VIDHCVYDVTKWLPHHPGGKTLMKGVARDSTYFFELYHRSKNSIQLLKKYFIGILSPKDHMKLPHQSESPSDLFLEHLRSTRTHPTR